MPYTKINQIIYGFFILFSLATGIAYSLDDGFGSAKKIESNHFTIYYAPELEIATLTQQLNISPSDEILVGKSSREGNPLAFGLADMLDTLFMRVCDILDMQLYSFKGNIKICKDDDYLKAVYKNLFDKNLTRSSFYVNALNTIYISQESFQQEILGHEIGHAIISHYFVVSPSVKIQEVLAGYVEYQLRRTGK